MVNGATQTSSPCSAPVAAETSGLPLVVSSERYAGIVLAQRASMVAPGEGPASAQPRRFQFEMEGARCEGLEVGEGQPVVLVHGLGHDLSDWCEVFARRPAGVRLIAVDLPGFGLSERPTLGGRSKAPAETRFTTPFEVLEAALAAVVERCETPPVVVGSSLGGHLALKLASRDGRAPARPVVDIAGLVLLAPGGLQAVPEAWLPVLRAAFSTSTLLARTDDAVLASSRALFGSAANSRSSDAHRERIALRKLALHRSPHAEDAYRAIEEVVDGVFGQVLSDEEIDRLPRPLHVVWGDADVMVPREGPQRLANRAGAHFHVVAGGGHLPMLEHAARVVDVLLQVMGTRGVGAAKGDPHVRR